MSSPHNIIHSYTFTLHTYTQAVNHNKRSTQIPIHYLFDRHSLSLLLSHSEFKLLLSSTLPFECARSCVCVREDFVVNCKQTFWTFLAWKYVLLRVPPLNTWHPRCLSAIETTHVFSFDVLPSTLHQLNAAANVDCAAFWTPASHLFWKGCHCISEQNK